jgi:hypothetical protein
MTPGTPNEAEATPVEPVRYTRGFVAFLGVMVLPAVIALGVVLGAAVVADEVYAAEDDPTQDVAAWKESLVGICPIH